MDAERFATERYEDQRRWYSDKATHYKQIAHRVSVAIVVMSVLLPVTTSSLPCDWSYRWISVVLSLGIGLATGLAGIFRWRELWITYRATEESLKREHSFLCHTSEGIWRNGTASTAFCRAHGGNTFWRTSEVGGCRKSACEKRYTKSKQGEKK